MRSYRRFVCIGLLACWRPAFAQDPAAKQLQAGESEVYNEIVKDINDRNFNKALTDFDAWQQKFPKSEFRDDGAALQVQALAGLNQLAKALDVAGALMTRGLDSTYPGPDGQPTIIRILYSATWAISNLPNPSAEQLSTGEKAARQLMAYDKQLPGVSAAQWEQARADMKAKAAAALFYIAMLPGAQAMAKHPPDCAAAEAGYANALGAYPDKSVLSYEMGRALNCLSKENPDKLFLAIYEFQRAAVIDPTLGDPKGDPKKVTTFADNSYVRVHGSDEGLEQLKQLVKLSALPPEGFKIKTASEIAEEKRAEFERSNPQLAMWMKIKGALTAADGAQYFESQMKDLAVPLLRGTLVEAKPACRSKELTVAVPLPDAPQPLVGEIHIKLAKPLTGRPELNSEFQWEGVATAFTKDPFLLTMDTEAAKIQGLKMASCPATPIRKK